jgi:hypothetical protein
MLSHLALLEASHDGPISPAERRQALALDAAAPVQDGDAAPQPSAAARLSPRFATRDELLAAMARAIVARTASTGLCRTVDLLADGFALTDIVVFGASARKRAARSIKSAKRRHRRSGR